MWICSSILRILHGTRFDEHNDEVWSRSTFLLFEHYLTGRLFLMHLNLLMVMKSVTVKHSVAGHQYIRHRGIFYNVYVKHTIHRKCFSLSLSSASGLFMPFWEHCLTGRLFLIRLNILMVMKSVTVKHSVSRHQYIRHLGIFFYNLYVKYDSQELSLSSAGGLLMSCWEQYRLDWYTIVSNSLSVTMSLK